ncbi:MAG: glycosyltransferase family 4 protein [Leptolyngbyaceae cyanobacterium]
MKIAVIGAKGIPPKQGGVEHYCAEVYPRMVSQGHEVDLYGRQSYTDTRLFEQHYFRGVRVLPLPGPRGGIDALTTSALGALLSLKEQYDIIHFHALGPALFSSIAKFSSAKVVVTCHGLDWQRAKWNGLTSWLIRSGERSANSWADEIIVVSKALQSYFLQGYDRPTTHITNAPAHYAPADPDFNYGKSLGLQQGRYLVFLGRLVPEKRPDLLIEAFKKLEAPDWKLVFIGAEGGAAEYCQELFAAAANCPNIVFAGEQRGAHLSELVQGAGLFVQPSDIEGLPLSLLEAMREGIPVVASDIPPHKQLLAPDRGLLFRAGDLDNCFKSLRLAIADPEAMSEMATAATAYVESNHSWDKITGENLKVYEQLLSKSGDTARVVTQTEA